MAVLYRPMHDWDIPATGAARPTVTDAVLLQSKALWIGAAVTTAVFMITAFGLGLGDATSHLPLVPDHAGAPPIPGRVAAHVLVRPPAVLAAYVLALFTCCYALLRIVAQIAAPDTLRLAIGAVLLGVTYLDTGSAVLSGATVIGGYFTATQVAVALAMLSLAMMLDRSPVLAVAMLGLVVEARPEIALWTAVALAGASFAMRDASSLARSWLSGGALALLLAAPAALWWGHAAGTIGFPDGDVASLMLLQPNQWLVGSVPLASWVLFGSVVVLGLAACSVLGPDARPACGAFLGLLATFLLGCVLPVVTESRWLLALRPMASDSFLQLLAAAATAAVVVRDLHARTGLLRVVFSVLAAACLLLHPFLLPVAALAMLARAAAAHGELLGIERRIGEHDWTTLCRAACGMVIAAGLAGCALRSGMLPL